MPKDDGMSFYEKVTDYKVIKEWEAGGYKCATLCTHNGTTVNLRIPIRTPEEEMKISENITEAITEFMFPGVDLSNTYMEIKR